MTFTLKALLLAVGLFAAMVILQELGRRFALRRAARDPEGARAGAGVVDGAIFALLGLLIAFTFSGAASRFDERRKLIVEEANAIGTAYLRIDLLPAAAQGEMRESFRRYLDARLAAYRASAGPRGREGRSRACDPAPAGDLDESGRVFRGDAEPRCWSCRRSIR